MSSGGSGNYGVSLLGINDRGVFNLTSFESKTSGNDEYSSGITGRGAGEDNYGSGGKTGGYGSTGSEDYSVSLSLVMDNVIRCSLKNFQSGTTTGGSGGGYGSGNTGSSDYSSGNQSRGGNYGSGNTRDTSDYGNQSGGGLGGGNDSYSGGGSGYGDNDSKKGMHIHFCPWLFVFDGDELC